MPHRIFLDGQKKKCHLTWTIKWDQGPSRVAKGINNDDPIVVIWPNKRKIILNGDLILGGLGKRLAKWVKNWPVYVNSHPFFLKIRHVSHSNWVSENCCLHAWHAVSSSFHVLSCDWLEKKYPFFVINGYYRIWLIFLKKIRPTVIFFRDL